MIILISGSVGSGKTTIANLLQKKNNFEIIHLNEITNKFKIKEIKELQTFDFDLDKFLEFIEQKINNFNKTKKNVILEGHFAQFINPKLIDFLFIINRDLKKLKKEYEKRKYNLIKQDNNLEVESFNLCFYEGIEEGYKEEKQIFCLENNEKLENIVKKIENIYSKKLKNRLCPSKQKLLKILSNSKNLILYL